MPRAWTAISSQARITREYVSRLEAGRYDPTVGVRGKSYCTLGAILNTLWALREFDIIYVTTGGGPDRATETLAVRIYQEAFAFFRMGTASALGVLTMLLAVLLALASMRTLRREYF